MKIEIENQVRTKPKAELIKILLQYVKNSVVDAEEFEKVCRYVAATKKDRECPDCGGRIHCSHYECDTCNGKGTI